MTNKTRSFGYSLVFHTFFGAIFFFLLTYNTPPKPPEPIKITLNAYVPQPSQPQEVQKSKPIEPPKQIVQPQQKPIPQKIVQAPIAIKPPVPQPTLPIQQPITPPVTPPVAPPSPPQPPKKVAPQLPPPPPQNVQKEFLNAHLGEIRGLLVQNLKYPKMAQKLKMQGEVRIAFSLDSDGSVSNIKVVESSGFDLLDSDAAELIEKTASRFPKPSESVRISVPLSYVLH